MARREYTQTVKPVSRIPEKIFGWLAWLSLLGIIGFFLYSLLVTGNDPNFMNGLEKELAENPDLAEFRQMIADNNMTIPELADAVMKGAWWALAYLVLPLILGLIGLLSMKKRILAGLLLLIAGLLTLPMFVLFWIPLFFIIAAILLFVRKDKVITNDDYYDDNRSYDRHREVAPAYVDRDERINQEKDYTYQPGVERDTVIEERPVDTTVNEEVDRKEHYVDTNSVERDEQVTYHHADDRDRVKFVDHTKDATEERRQNYNDRMNNRD